ncbi:MAG: hypothetical protein Q8Q10_02015 [bacterium]|nr:hypothetical protein [bacterium]
MGIKTDGTLWAWVGPDGYGALGLGTDYQSVAYYSTPHQVGSDSNWADVQAGYHSTVALKTNGTLWGWGANQWGQLGLGDTTHRYSPTRIGTDTNWASVSMRSNESVQAIKTDGTLWAWGQNVYGNLGLGTGGTYYGPSSPTRVGADSDWAKVSVGNFPYEYAMAIKTNGTLWGWGANSNGQLGLGDTTNRYSPTRVGTGTNWGSVSAGSYYTLAITGTPPPPSTLKACMDSCTTGASAITSLAMSQNDTRTIVACYNTATACNAPDNTGNVTLSSLWEESGTDVVSLSNQSNSTKKFQSGTAYGTETVTITHLTQSVALNVTVPCVETATCDSEQNKVCSDKTVPAGTTLSGICGTVDCGGKSGKRYCDFNWKEVAP